eukprot:TRINITY_DN9250_c0_g1_i12.p1 TRINITY_DN9250_c0_g1~~TRINITY_DN9250_c0_g1_i12.p1  ORF type:complete len:422 (+),score=101.33 TRINITY_DN9250_c0_g1_i12:30-1268(+)
MIRRPPRSTHCISSAASDVYKRQVHGECPVVIYAKSCGEDENSTITVAMEETSDPYYMLGEPENLNIPPNKKRVSVIPDVAPGIDSVKIIVEEMALLRPVKKGTLTLEQGIGGKKQTIELNGAESQTEMSMNNKESNYSGDYYVTVEATDELNFRIRHKMYATIDGKQEEVMNFRRASLDRGIDLFPVNQTYQYAYFTLRTKNEPGTVLAISSHGISSVDNVSISVSNKPWGSGYEWHMDLIDLDRVLRLPRDGSYYYIKIEGIPSPEYTVDGEHPGMIHPFIMESQRYQTLIANRNYTFSGTQLFRFKVKPGMHYIITKMGKTAESIFVSLNPNNKLPLDDDYDHGRSSMGEADLSLEFEKTKVHKIDLASIALEHLKEVCITVRAISSGSYYNLFIEEYADTKSPRTEDL